MLLAQIGVIFLLFEVGADTDLGRLVSVGGQSAAVAATGVVLPFVLGWAACRWMFGMSAVVSVFVGGTLVATSIGITLRVLKDLGMHRGATAQVVLGSAVLDDVVGVVILAVLLEYNLAGSLALASSLRTLGFVAVFIAAAPLLGRAFVPFAARAQSSSRTGGMTSTVVVALILLLSALAHTLGAPEIIGAFAAGLVFSRAPLFPPREDGRRLWLRTLAGVREKTAPVGELFVPVFFVMVGVSIDFGVIDLGSSRFWVFAGVITSLAFVSKLAGGVWAKGPLAGKLAVGVAMIPRGEVGLIFAETGLKNGVFDETVYASMVFVVALTTLLAPLVLRAMKGAWKKEGAHRGGGRGGRALR